MSDEPDKKDLLKRLRIGQNFQDRVGVERKIVSLPMRKPNKQEFVRVHPSENYRLDLAVVTVEDDGKRITYALDPALLTAVADAYPVKMALSVSRQGAYFLWPIKISADPQVQNSWNLSAMAAMEEATKNWIRVVSNMSAGSYDVLVLQVPAPDPEWPKESFEGLLKIAVRNQLIDSLDHPVLKRLRGEA